MNGAGKGDRFSWGIVAPAAGIWRMGDRECGGALREVPVARPAFAVLDTTVVVTCEGVFTGSLGGRVRLVVETHEGDVDDGRRADRLKFTKQSVQHQASAQMSTALASADQVDPE